MQSLRGGKWNRSCRDSRGAGVVFPVLFGAAMLGVGVESLLDAIVSYLPAPSGSDANALSALVFKIESGGASGRVTHARVFEGTIERGKPLPNETTNEAEKPSRLLKLTAGGAYESVDRLEAGTSARYTGFVKAKLAMCLAAAMQYRDPLRRRSLC